MPSKQRGHNEGSITERADGRWEAKISLPGGQRKSIYGKTRADVAARLTATLADVQRGLPVVSEKETLGDFLAQWLEDTAKPTLRPSTFVSYSEIVKLHLIPALGRIRLARLTPQDVQKLLRAKQGSGLSPRRVLYIRAVLRRALGQALKWGMVARNSAALVDPPRVENDEVSPLTPEQVRVFLDGIAGDRLDALYIVAIGSGLRQGELLGLRWQDVDLEQGTLTVKNALQRIAGKLQLVEPKTRRSRRTITLPRMLLQALREHRARQLGERLHAGATWQDGGFVFATPIGTPLDNSNVTHNFQKTLERLGLPRQKFHDLRHCAASLLLSQGMGLRDVMEVLGHSQISLTANTYGHLYAERRQDIADAMDRALGS